MSVQREAALHERRTRIRNYAKRMVWVTFTKEGTHTHPAATSTILKTGDEYDVSFLGSPHRHIFNFNVAIQVYNNDNSIEPVQFKRWIESMYGEGSMILEQKSCDMISDDLYEAISARYPGRDIEISVSEDGENGSTVRYSTHQATQQLSI